MAKSDVKLLMVTADNNNKFYNMHDNNNGTFTATWGRYGTAGKDTVYPISKWDSTIRSKIAKGYEDVTANTARVCEYKAIDDKEINTLLNAFLENSRQFISKFTESTAISDVAAEEAQKHIDNMVKNLEVENSTAKTLEAFNKELLKLFEIIPRKMHRVRDNLCTNLDSRMSHITQEQSLLDNLISMSKKMPTSSGTQTIEDAFGFTISQCSAEDIKFIKNKLKNDGFNRYTFNRAWVVSTPSREEGFIKYLEDHSLENNEDNVKMYWHGTGTENVLSILSTGLLIKPANASFCGSAYGVGIYDAPNADKASGYTSIAGSGWRGGSSRVAYMFINAVIMGKQFDVKDNYEMYEGTRIRDLTTDKFESKKGGYHSVYAHAGGYLKRDEAIVYNQNQVACRFLVEFKC